MVNQSGIRDNFRSNSLKELALERRNKKSKAIEDTDDDDSQDESDRLHKFDKNKRPCTKSLIASLPKPKNSNPFGVTVKLDELLSNAPAPHRHSESRKDEDDASSNVDGDNYSDIVEVNVSRMIGDIQPSIIKGLSVERATPGSTVVLPKGKEKQKNQITYLAKLGKATELERKEQAAIGRANKAAARSKYGW